MQYCESHQDIAISCSKISEMSDNIKAIRDKMDTVINNMQNTNKQVAVMEERWKNAKWIVGMIVVAELGLLAAVAKEYFTN